MNGSSARVRSQKIFHGKQRKHLINEQSHIYDSYYCKYHYMMQGSEETKLSSYKIEKIFLSTFWIDNL
jgi:hypothetical protein